MQETSRTVKIKDKNNSLWLRYWKMVKKLRYIKEALEKLGNSNLLSIQKSVTSHWHLGHLMCQNFQFNLFSFYSLNKMFTIFKFHQLRKCFYSHKPKLVEKPTASFTSQGVSFVQKSFKLWKYIKIIIL